MALIDNLLHYWTLDEASGTRADSHGSADLTETGTVSGVAGKLNNAADFDAAMEKLASASIGTDNTKDYTFSAWVYLDGGAGDYQNLANFRWDATEEGGWWLGFSSDSKPAFFTINSGFLGFTSTTAISTGAWHHVVWRFAASGAITCWVDGALNSSGTHTRAANASSGFSLGISYLNNTNPIDGKIDEVGLWDRLLSDGEVAELSPGGEPLPYEDFAGVVGHPASRRLGLAKSGLWFPTHRPLEIGRAGAMVI